MTHPVFSRGFACLWGHASGSSHEKFAARAERTDEASELKDKPLLFATVLHYLLPGNNDTMKGFPLFKKKSSKKNKEEPTPMAMAPAPPPAPMASLKSVSQRWPGSVKRRSFQYKFYDNPNSRFGIL